MPLPRRDFIGALGLAAAAPGNAATSVDWPAYAGDALSSRYSSLDQITPANVSRLEPAWVHHSAPEGARYRGSIECTPLVVGGRMFLVGAGLAIQALDPASGRLLWTNAPLGAVSGRRASGISRGLVYWTDGKDERLYVPVQSRIWCLDARTSKPVENFGESGSIDLEKDVDRDMTGLSLVSTTPGVIYRDLLIVPTRTEEGPRPAAPGHIRAYDIHTGKRR
jgi:quinoprotein glucose dehydrogenase